MSPHDAVLPVTSDLEHGGRWTSLTLGGRDWLWHRENPRRLAVGPHSPFVDVGGVEECIPTIRGFPDHGEAWRLPWEAVGPDEAAWVQTNDFRLERSFRGIPGGVSAAYRLTAQPGFRFIWAAHALLDLSTSAWLELPIETEIRLFPEAASHLEDEWPSGARYRSTRWPSCGGIPMRELGPVDGSAIGAIAVHCAQASVHDGDHSLRLDLRAEGQPTSVAIWRNLGGFPETNPYRSIGVEPMLGSVFDLADVQDEEDAATVPPGGVLDWELRITCFELT